MRSDDPLSLDEVAPPRRDRRVRAEGDPEADGDARRPSRRVQMLVGLAIVLLVGSGLTVAAVAGPAPDNDIGQGAALVAAVTIATAPPTTATTTPAASPPVTEAGAVPAGDCSTPGMCGDITSDGPCDDAGMCGEIRADDTCADDSMCGDIPAPSDCADPTMCGEIVPAPATDGG
jgi:hypothetical protein